MASSWVEVNFKFFKQQFGVVLSFVLSLFQFQ